MRKALYKRRGKLSEGAGKSKEDNEENRKAESGLAPETEQSKAADAESLEKMLMEDQDDKEDEMEDNGLLNDPEKMERLGSGEADPSSLQDKMMLERMKKMKGNR